MADTKSVDLCSTWRKCALYTSVGALFIAALAATTLYTLYVHMHSVVHDQLASTVLKCQASCRGCRIVSMFQTDIVHMQQYVDIATLHTLVGTNDPVLRERVRRRVTDLVVARTNRTERLLQRVRTIRAETGGTTVTHHRRIRDPRIRRHQTSRHRLGHRTTTTNHNLRTAIGCSADT
jgi:hypothetical protein